MRSLEHERRAIREYVELEAPEEKVTHLEKVTTERLFDRKLDAWDVWTDKDRYWVITNPTNLYLQSEFRSLDFAISFHVGLTARVMAGARPRVSEEEQRRFLAVWRQWTEAAEALDNADEAEHFQAVGMRCRECLLAFIRTVDKDDMLPSGRDAPKHSDFVAWAELIAERVAGGQHAERLRGYLKSVSKATWELVNWLTHATNAVRFDAQIALDATENVLSAFGTALIRLERGIPDRCPSCSSYRLTSDYRSDLDRYVTICDACEWTEPQPSGS